MASSSLEGKTIRPGSLGSYSYYRSARRPDSPRPPSYIAASRSRLIPWKLLFALLALAVLIVGPMWLGGGDSGKAPAAAKSTQSQQTAPASSAPAVVAAPVKNTNHCAGQNGKIVIVSISQRHMWACQQGKSVYDSTVITGMTAYPATETPVGTYHIYAKQTNVTLTGTDITGSWSDPVSYWMPFLDNQYGTYGFHDATWRSNDAFGKVDPASSDASHGCVELPIATSHWLYDWASVGTPVTIQN